VAVSHLREDKSEATLRTSDKRSLRWSVKETKKSVIFNLAYVNSENN
jgi:hypothetical protein